MQLGGFLQPHALARVALLGVASGLIITLSFLVILNAFQAIGWTPHAAVQAALIITLWASLLITAAVRRANELLLALVGAALLVAAVTFIHSWVFDSSFDGMGYHKAAILQLGAGWNPWQTESARYIDKPWVEAYPKAQWQLSALIIGVTGRLNTASTVNTLWLMAALCTTFAALRLTTQLTNKAAWAGALVCAASPIVAAQVFTSCVDGALASLLTLIAVSCWAHWQHEAPDTLGRWFAVIAGCAGIIAAATKHTGLVYVAAGATIYSAFWVWRLRRPRKLRPALRRGAAWLALGACALALVGFQPYGRAWLEKGHPLWPHAGKGAENVLATQAAAVFLNQPMLYRFAQSLASPPSNWSAEGSIMGVIPKAAFLLPAWEDVTNMRHSDVRFGGFGPLARWLWPIAILIALAAARVSWRATEPSRTCSLWVLLGIVVASVLANPANWWARFVPQLWLALGLVAVLGLLSSAARVRRAAWVLLGLALLNVALIFVVATGRLVLVEQRFYAAIGADRVARIVNVNPHFILTWQRYYLEQGVRVEWLDQAQQCPKPLAARVAIGFGSSACAPE